MSKETILQEFQLFALEVEGIGGGSQVALTRESSSASTGLGKNP